MTGQKKDFILVVAGEDSGDIIGERIVFELLQRGYRAVGTGGWRMKEAGLETIANFEDMAVNGFIDVFKKLPKLFSVKTKLIKTLKNKNCKALFCIDYPGINLELTKLAKKINKHVFYIAPPKIWAWKSYRGKHLKGVSVGVFFDFEKEFFEKIGINAILLKHPCFLNTKLYEEFKDKVLFLPGSRIGQVRRNLQKYMKIAKNYENAVFVAPRKEIKDFLNKKLGEKYHVVIKPSDCSYAGAQAAFCMPGTVALETFTAGVPTTAIAVVDPLTYVIGKLFIKTKYLTLPNIIHQKEIISEKVYISLGLCL